MNVIVEKALISLTEDCNTTMLHPQDEDLIKLTLKVLNKHGVKLESDEIESWLLENSWEPSPVKSLVTWAKTISEGGRVQLKYKSMLPSEKSIWEHLNA